MMLEHGSGNGGMRQGRLTQRELLQERTTSFCSFVVTPFL